MRKPGKPGFRAQFRSSHFARLSDFRERTRIKVIYLKRCAAVLETRNSHSITWSGTPEKLYAWEHRVRGSNVEIDWKRKKTARRQLSFSRLARARERSCQRQRVLSRKTTGSLTRPMNRRGLRTDEWKGLRDTDPRKSVGKSLPWYRKLAVLAPCFTTDWERPSNVTVGSVEQSSRMRPRH
jgi:hypothetical protein